MKVEVCIQIKAPAGALLRSRYGGFSSCLRKIRPDSDEGFQSETNEDEFDIEPFGSHEKEIQAESLGDPNSSLWEEDPNSRRDKFNFGYRGLKL